MTAIVVTTIFDMEALDSYAGNLLSWGQEGEATLYVIPDRRTDARLWQRVKSVRDHGVSVVFPSVEEQGGFLRKIGIEEGFIPFDSDNRRNVGFLMALADGADWLISIDDDNYCLPDVDFVSAHLSALRPGTESRTSLESSSSWVNVMDFLQYVPSVPVWPRGFPYFARNSTSYQLGETKIVGPVAMHAGLWIGDPDVDAVSRLAVGPYVKSYRDNCNYALCRGSWMPVNTQNTSLTRNAALAYYYVRMGQGFGALRLDRFGDILSGYLASACVKASCEHVGFGMPVVDHRRTHHDLLRDLGQEYFGMLLIEDLISVIMATSLSGNSYSERYRSLAAEVAEWGAYPPSERWPKEIGHFLTGMSKDMERWVSAAELL